EERAEARAERCEEEQAEAGSGAEEAQLAAETGHPARSLSGSRGSRPHPSESFSEEGVLVRRPHRDADRVRCAEPCERSDDHALTEKRLEQPLRILAHVREEEVADRGPGDAETSVAKDCLELGAARGVESATALELGRGVEARERGELRGRRQVECAAGLAESRHELGRSDRVANAQTGEPVDLRERPQDDNAPARLEVLLDGGG